MHKIFYCKRCLYPDTKPHLLFDENGICSACINFDNRSKINWAERKKNFVKLIKDNKKPQAINNIINTNPFFIIVLKIKLKLN